MKRNTIIGIVGIMVVLFAVNAAVACSCVLPDRNKSVKQLVTEAKASSVAVFVGKVVEIRYSKEKMGDQPLRMIAKFEVAGQWKGSVPQMVEVTTANICCICGVSFELGENYIVYANGTAKALTANSCSRTSVLVGKSPDEEFLGKRRLPNKFPRA
ncbi:MAG: hypothetical protein K1X36_08250 [Pyrinomonadaceae bacterium]|nr:hypothetical protein [Pyrinomonadaceae bacterium]